MAARERGIHHSHSVATSCWPGAQTQIVEAAYSPRLHNGVSNPGSQVIDGEEAVENHSGMNNLCCNLESFQMVRNKSK